MYHPSPIHLPPISHPSPTHLPAIPHPSPTHLPPIFHSSPIHLPPISHPSPTHLPPIFHSSPIHLPPIFHSSYPSSTHLPSISHPSPIHLPPISHPSPIYLPPIPLCRFSKLNHHKLVKPELVSFLTVAEGGGGLPVEHGGFHGNPNAVPLKAEAEDRRITSNTLGFYPGMDFRFLVEHEELLLTFRVRGDLWISYEDDVSLEQKINYLKNKSVGGVALFSQSEDDFAGTFCDKGKFPLSVKVYEYSDVLQGGNQLMLPWQRYCSSAQSPQMGQNGVIWSGGIMLVVLVVAS
ncbi:hypothetical protein EGW08_013232 [Elysia chlorotica]|uniref:GH18 domain-containing protein n=1 Tax=Elysia chlorotica TaxID=188477 RepID=A0A3S1BZN2_ELYCH|nr:hypothetical protein EGW08_013232 [Elysia chlorotica]